LGRSTRREPEARRRIDHGPQARSNASLAFQRSL
jgi:hypothetical protein